MSFIISAQDIVVSSTTIETGLRVQVSPGTNGEIETVAFNGLPSTVKVSPGQKKDDGSWAIPYEAFKDAKLQFEKNPQCVAQVEVEVIGKINGEPHTACAKFKLAVMPDCLPSKSWQKITILLMLLIVTIPVFYCWRLLYTNAQEILTEDIKVPWEKPKEIWLKAGPTTFWYDGTKLHHRGPIDAKLKLQLLGLAKVEKPGDKAALEDDPRLSTYISAIDGLTFKSNERLPRYFLYLLAIAGLSGVLGTQVRSLANFVYIATMRPKDLDASLWWPYYIVRPISGFLLGLLAVLLVEAKIYVPETQSVPSGTVWWMGIAMLVGFAADEFSQRLRLVGQALFGEEQKKEKKKPA